MGFKRYWKQALFGQQAMMQQEHGKRLKIAIKAFAERKKYLFRQIVANSVVFGLVELPCLSNMEF